ncbi:hypothetical protein C2L65_44910 [Paraburkholderia terrae]|uniref:Uncharacterized protein n=1 Tax=Paraburkholderia terrae TaxID=311230 RepID=A0A2I8F4T4_9BURK|nr:hypothetical protein [Paraburkholderia terrae]AUT66887.1 hypothetical protein C2L65_44910 [Paraburkholderia terrae]
MKNASSKSLRYQVDKWLAPAATSTVRAIEFGRTRWLGTRFVCVETSSASGARILYFFRHGDGAWHVFPPAVDRQESTSRRVGA